MPIFVFREGQKGRISNNEILPGFLKYGVKSPPRSSFVINTQVSVLNVTFTSKIWAFKNNKTHSLHSKSCPENHTSTKCSGKFKTEVFFSTILTIHFNNEVSASTCKPSFKHFRLYRTIKPSSQHLILRIFALSLLEDAPVTTNNF